MRIHHLFIAVIVFSLFAVMLYSSVNTLYVGDATEENGGLGMNKSEYLDGVSDGNATGLFAQLDVLSSTSSDVVDMADQAPGGVDSTVSGEDDTSEGALQKSGLSLVAKAGTFLYSIPKALIYEVAKFLHIDPRFALVASTILVLIVAIILVSSILRNRI